MLADIYGPFISFIQLGHFHWRWHTLSSNRTNKKANAIACEWKKKKLRLYASGVPWSRVSKWCHQNLGSLQFSCLYSLTRLILQLNLWQYGCQQLQSHILQSSTWFKSVCSLPADPEKVLLHFTGSDWFTRPSLNQTCRPGKKGPFYPTPRIRVASTLSKTHGVRIGVVTVSQMEIRSRDNYGQQK